MKKAFFALITVFLSLALFSCFFTAPETDKEAGDGMVKLAIQSNIKAVNSNSKAMTSALARFGYNYFEVVFSDGGTPTPKYYRKAWADWQSAPTIDVPPDDYAGADRAILFVGAYYEGDLTLLAAGPLTSVSSDGGTTWTTATTIVGSGTGKTNAVRFTLAALTSDVNKNASSTSTFRITGPTTPDDWETPTTGTLPTLTVGTTVYPIFRVPESDSNVTAEFTIGGITTSGAGIIINPPAGSAHKLGSGKYLYGSSFPAESQGLALKSATYTTIAGSLDDVNGKIDIAITTDALSTSPVTLRGYGTLLIEVPVSAIANNVPGGLTWYIRGGLNNPSLDAGAVVNSTGGAILLCTVSDHLVPVAITAVDP